MELTKAKTYNLGFEMSRSDFVGVKLMKYKVSLAQIIKTKKMRRLYIIRTLVL